MENPERVLQVSYFIGLGFGGGNSGLRSYRQEPEAGPNRFGTRAAQLSLDLPERFSRCECRDNVI